MADADTKKPEKPKKQARKGLFKRLWRMRILGAPIGAGIVFFIAGILFWGGYNTSMEWSNKMSFCISCHEMRSTVYAEYKKTIHFQNRSGVRATCADCHVPRPWVHKFVRKVQATNELWHWALGSINTPEKFEAKRLTLAKHVWADMKKTDSRECRNCHSWDSMTKEKQRRRAWKQHKLGRAEGDTCIDCHKGIAHRPVHELLTDKDDPYDGKPDKRKLPVLVAKTETPKATPAPDKPKTAEKLKAAQPAKAAKPAAKTETPPQTAAKPTETGAKPPETAAKPAPAGGGGIDWSAVKGTEITIFYPGQASYEWVLKGSDHGGARAIKKLGDPCVECHKKETAEMGTKVATGKKAEPTPIPGKRGSIKVAVKAAYDATNLHLWFRWTDAKHTPVPFAKGGKMDPANPMKFAIMFDDGKVEKAASMGCWATCHHDSRYMPDEPKSPSGDIAKRLGADAGITKYLTESRTEIEISGGDDAKRGGWDKLKPEAEIKAMLAKGVFMDLVRYSSGNGGKTESGYVLDRRIMTGGAKVAFTATLKDGIWTLVMTRPLKADKPGFVSFEPGKLYTLGFAIHDDYTTARFHHVSLEYKLGLGNAEADINAVKR